MTETTSPLAALAQARLSHAHWIAAAAAGGSGRYPAAYCLDGAAVWRRVIAELKAEARSAADAQ